MSASRTSAVGSRIRTQLFMLAGVAVLPLFLAFAYDVYQQAEEDLDRARANAQRLAKIAAADAQGYFARAEQRLGDIARRVEDGSLEPGRCRSLFADAETIRREYAALAILDKDGRVVCFAGEQNEQAVAGLTAARPLLAHADGPPRLSAGVPVRSAAADGWVLPLAFPVRGGDGRAAGVVIAAAQLDRFQSVVESLDLPEKPITLFLKADGTVIYFSHDPERHVGQSRRDDALTRSLLEGRSGVTSGVSVDGVARIYGFHPAAGTDWLAVVGLDAAPIRAGVRASAVRQGLYGLGVLLLALLLSFALSRRISGPVSALAVAVRGYGEGRRETRAAVAGAREVAEVAMLMNRMFDMLAEQERSLIESQDKLNGVLGSMDRALWSFAPDMSTMLFASVSTEQIFGHTVAEFMAWPRLWLDLAHPEERKQAEAVIDRLALSGAEVLEYRIVLPGGGTRWVEIRWRHVTDAAGRRLRVDGIVADITERKQAEEENRQLLAIVEQSLNEIYVFDAITMRYEYANGGALHNLGYSFRHLKLLTPLDLMPQYTEGSFARLIEQLLRRERAQQVFETVHRRSDGSEYPVEAHIQAVEREGRWKCLAVVIDITERQLAQSEIVKLTGSLEKRVSERTTELAQANAELESFIYSISHDLRTPLRAINGYASILVDEQKGRLDGEAVDMLQRIARGAVRMGDLIDDLLTFSRVGRGELNRMEVDMEAMARTVVEELRATYPHAEVVIEAMPGARADPALLRQVMINLVGNAMKFSSNRADARIAVGAIREDGLPAYFVRDNGAGFDSQHAAKLFGVFQRLHRESEFPGTGVGLAIVKRIVERHGGRVWAESAPGKGATFFFTLP